MQDNRDRLAVELDGALGRARALEAANAEAAEKLAQAGAAMKALIERLLAADRRIGGVPKAGGDGEFMVTIGGHGYRLACNEGEEAHLEELARVVDAKFEAMQNRSAKSATSA